MEEKEKSSIDLHDMTNIIYLQFAEYLITSRGFLFIHVCIHPDECIIRYSIMIFILNKSIV